MIRTVTITIKLEKNYGLESFANLVHAAIPTRDDIRDYRERSIPAILPIGFRYGGGDLRSTIEFSDDK